MVLQSARWLTFYCHNILHFCNFISFLFRFGRIRFKVVCASMASQISIFFTMYRLFQRLHVICFSQM